MITILTILSMLFSPQKDSDVSEIKETPNQEAKIIQVDQTKVDDVLGLIR